MSQSELIKTFRVFFVPLAPELQFLTGVFKIPWLAFGKSGKME